VRDLLTNVDPICEHCDASVTIPHPFSCQMFCRNAVEVFVIGPFPGNHHLEGLIVLFNQFPVDVDTGIPSS
jgi:hypothetical protein